MELGAEGAGPGSRCPQLLGLPAAVAAAVAAAEAAAAEAAVAAEAAAAAVVAEAAEAAEAAVAAVGEGVGVAAAAPGSLSYGALAPQAPWEQCCSQSHLGRQEGAAARSPTGRKFPERRELLCSQHLSAALWAAQLSPPHLCPAQSMG